MIIAEENNLKSNYQLNYSDEGSGRNISFNLDVSDDAPWWETHEEMLRFLSAIYGFDISRELDRKYREILKGQIW